MMMRMKAYKGREEEDHHKCHLEMEVANINNAGGAK